MMDHDGSVMKLAPVVVLFWCVMGWIRKIFGELGANWL